MFDPMIMIASAYCMSMAAGLILDRHEPQPAHQFRLDIVPLVVHGRAAEREDSQRVVDLLPNIITLGIFDGGGLYEGRVAGLFHPLGVQVDLLPACAARLAIQRLGAAERIDRQLEARRALGAERAAADWAVGVALDIDNLAALDANKRGAANRAVGADAGHLFRIADLERFSVRPNRLKTHPQRDRATQTEAAAGNLQELAPTDGLRFIHSLRLLVRALAERAHF